MDQTVILVGNGPSAADRADDFRDIRGQVTVARMNFFFLEDLPRFGTQVDHYFWGVDRPALHDGLRDTLAAGRYRIDRFWCPLTPDRMAYTDGPVAPRPFFDPSRLSDHWQVIGRCDRLGRTMMSRPLPTMGLQAMATLALLGARRIHVFGLDFYQSADRRYAWDVPPDLVAKLGPKHVTPGYEAGAHALALDLDFLDQILLRFPDLDLVNHSHFDGLDDIAARRRAAAARPRPNRPPPDALAALTAPVAPPPDPAVADLAARIDALEQRLAQAQAAATHTARGTLILDRWAADGLPWSDLTVVLHERASLAGVHRPLTAALDIAARDRRARPLVVDLSDRDPAALDLAVDLAHRRPMRVLVNSVAAFRDPRLSPLLAAADRLFIYLHETDWTLSRLRDSDPAAWDRFLSTLPRATVLCVSPAQADWVRATFAPAATAVIWNTVDSLLPPAARALRRAAGPRVPGPVPRIGMVGSWQLRKGTDLFQDTARLFAANGLPGTFEWVGKLHEGKPDSACVTFHGPQDAAAVARFLDGLDVLFLPSRDDPQPLAALEAAACGVRIVCHAGTGTAEWARGIGGCAVFDRHAPDAAAQALLSALAQPFDAAAADTLLSARFDPATFTDTLAAVLGSPASDAAVAPPGPADLVPGNLRADLARLADAAGLAPADRIAAQTRTVRDAPEDIRAWLRLADLVAGQGDRALAARLVQAGCAVVPGKASHKRLAAEWFLAAGAAPVAQGLALSAVRQNPASTANAATLARINEALAQLRHGAGPRAA